MIGEVTAKVVEVSAKVAAEATKETAKETGKAIAEKGVDISKRLDVSKKAVDSKMPGVDITKRITPDTMGKELTLKQQTELASKGMSPGIFKDIRFEDGVYKLKTKNEALANKKHPETGVPYSKKVVDLFGSKIEGVFPKFDSAFTTHLPADILKASDKVQFDYCNSQLKNAIKDNPALAKRFSPRQLEQISKGYKPEGFTWNHNEEVGKMELVEFSKHMVSRHTGGKAIWGGGADFR